MLRALYDRTIALSGGRWAPLALALVAFAESSVFPIPPEVLLIPMVLAAREQAWRFAAICTVASVLGGYLGYILGYTLFETVGKPILAFYGLVSAFDTFAARYNEYGGWIVAFFGLTPFPYKAVTIASGATRLDPVVFGVASVLSRGSRFFLEALLLWWLGPPIRAFIERRLGLVLLVLTAGVVGGIAALALLT